MNKVGTVIEKIQGFYFVDSNNEIYKCKLRGILKRDKRDKNCVVGDIVEFTDDNSIINVKDRKNFIIRPTAANIDYLLICFAIDKPKYDLDTINTLILNAHYNNINPIVVLNKIDLVDNAVLEKTDDIFSFLEDINIPFFTISVENNIGINRLKEYIKDGKSVFSGPSGVGKSSIINCILSNANQKIGDISKKIYRGKHTTRSSKLLKIEKNAYIIDTPGFSVIDIPPIENKNDLQLYFPEIKNNLGKCKFSNCIHINEPKCFIKNSVAENKISKTRYDFYKKIYNEI